MSAKSENKEDTTMNTNAIDKIISRRAMRDHKAACSKYPESFKKYNAGIISRKPRGYYSFSYSLGSDTMEAVETRRDYVSGKITEEEYKAYCLKQNLIRE